MTESTVRQVLLADIGEGLVEALLVEYVVEVGQTVNRLDAVAEVETDKAIVQITTPYSGTVTRLIAEPGAYVNVGDPVLEVTGA